MGWTILFQALFSHIQSDDTHRVGKKSFLILSIRPG
jgi:hypothetical protein